MADFFVDNPTGHGGFNTLIKIPYKDPETNKLVYPAKFNTILTRDRVSNSQFGYQMPLSPEMKRFSDQEYQFWKWAYILGIWSAIYANDNEISVPPAMVASGSGTIELVGVAV